MLNVTLASQMGPFYSEDEVARRVGTKNWVLNPRFGLLQKGSARGIDDGASSKVNATAQVQEKLQVPSTDDSVAVIRTLNRMLPNRPLGGWVLDERKAYRQLPLHPSQRCFGVVGVWDPVKGKVGFFAMRSHSFGHMAAVYNYNRMAAGITSIIRRVMRVLGYNYYDAKF